MLWLGNTIQSPCHFTAAISSWIKPGWQIKQVLSAEIIPSSLWPTDWSVQVTSTENHPHLFSNTRFGKDATEQKKKGKDTLMQGFQPSWKNFTPAHCLCVIEATQVTKWTSGPVTFHSVPQLMHTHWTWYLVCETHWWSINGTDCSSRHWVIIN